MFMHNLLKQIGQLEFRSWSWFVGQDVRMIGGAIRDFGRAPFKQVTGTGPKDTRWTSKMDNAVAMPIIYGTLAALYQFWKTGEGPKDVHDLVAPRTGGTDPQSGQPQRALMPGAEKDPAQFWMHPEQEIEAKKSKFMSEIGIPMAAPGKLLQSTGVQGDIGKDFRGDPILSGAEDAPPWLSQVWDYIAETYTPISMQRLQKGRKEGSGFSLGEEMLGMREVPAYMRDKEAFDDMMERMQSGAYRKKQKHQEKQRSLYEE
jgi:hypothetical protein